MIFFASTFDIKCRDDDIVANLPLQERQRGDVGIVSPEIEDTEGWRPGVHFDRIQDAVSDRTGWKLDRDGMRLGFFSFAKSLMLRDLDPENWPENPLAENATLRNLLSDGFESEPPLFGCDDSLDERSYPAEIIQVVDADASQTKVTKEAREEV